ncbi:YbjQ family protein [Candidatus Palauibacter sp.]|uniref:YbjQ family protein n=1 Tax=Candidatus Palauibacter sp. TaxID=3101350 RepID=UPI003AF1E86E
MIISSRNDLSGHRIVEEFGLVRGSTIRARHLGRDILAGLKSVVGGEIQEYTKMMAESREQAIDRMEREAANLGANAVLCVRFSTSYVMGGTAEIVVYGSAVKVETDQP